MKLRVGTDCSGIEAPIQALRNLGIQYEHIFSSDIDKFVKLSHNANYSPKYFYDDIKTPRSHKLDIYVAGFPCQSFSSAGKRKGIEDERGTIFNYVIKNIIDTDTNIFILENVPGLLTIDNGNVFNEIIEKLNDIGSYTIYHKVLNTKDYGIPQNRRRLYIVGIKKELKFDFKWPEKKEMKNLKEYIDYSDTSTSKIPVNKQEILEKIKNSKATFLNLGFWNFKSHSYKDYCQTITSSSPYYNLKMNRKMNIKEMLKLQGFPEDFKVVCSYTQMKKQIGNSMSVNVIEEIIKNLKCIFSS